MKILRPLISVSALAALFSGVAHALPENAGYTLQEAATLQAEELHVFHNAVLMPIITFICLLVLALLIWVVIRYNSKSHPEPKKFSHNTLIEVIWTGVPVLILLYIALFSFELLFKEATLPDGRMEEYAGDGSTTEFVFDNTEFAKSRNVSKKDHIEVWSVNGGTRTELVHREDYSLEDLGKDQVTVKLASAPTRDETIKIVGGRSLTGPNRYLGLFGEDKREIVTAPTLTLKVTGYQWGWNYAYPDYGDFEFDALLTPKDEVSSPELYLFEATNNIVVPEGEVVRVIVSARDVIHSWAMPPFGLKIDAVPGRLNETWFKAPSEPGVFYGQCSEICGKDHAFMPIALEIKSRADFEKWVDEQREMNGYEPLFAATEETKLADATTGSAGSR